MKKTGKFMHKWHREVKKYRNLGINFLKSYLFININSLTTSKQDLNNKNKKRTRTNSKFN